MDYINSIASILIKRIITKIKVQHNSSKKNILFFNTRNNLINLFTYFNLTNIAKNIDIDENSIVNIFYEDSTTKFRTISTGNICKLKQKILEIKNYNTDYFVNIPTGDDDILIKNIFFVNSKLEKIDVKKILSEYIEYDYEIKISDLIDNTIICLEIEYYLNFKLERKKIDIKNILDFHINNMNNIIYFCMVTKI